ncbi:BZ3500_MvSof-1268-A1-R1_Chr6-3g08940 [Microbotryum saponariae]|uniref:BZ3500_MvSof-1268-A1-R1_Chr6-3g08940 protein n=1 Tax=Microbotryum saponariae TaxID=289078 RepID=A0A2X0LD91_9BASI|nr:BZ3500_MvSof-1268-A1-R1_Chr6-3g08940 [Microbotryum saponariae]SDA07542.1 BZ3501_MvSof-1269-A2-R1_Chr6-2g08644 [Microbotryum saponariae]
MDVDRAVDPPKREFRSSRYNPDRDSGSRATGSTPYDPVRKAAARQTAAIEASKHSKKENRVYITNLSFNVKWNDLKDFMREAGNVVFSEIMTLPNGMSKGCGVVEFSRPEEAQRAISQLNEQPLLGRPVYVREDREEEARYGSAAVSGPRPGYTGPGALTAPTRGGFSAGVGRGGGFASSAPALGQGRHLFIQGLPANAGWQELKDLFRAAGQIIRADVKTAPDGTPTGTGTVVFETSQDAQNAIAMYNGYEIDGAILEVREDRFPTGGGGGGFVPRGGFAGGRGGFRGGFTGGFGAPPPHLPFAPPGFMQGGFKPLVATPNKQIFVRNLPWSTADDDLVELFQTTGTVEEAAMLIDEATGRAKGSGVVQFATIEEAQTAIAQFQGYTYGGRPLQIEFNARYKNFQGNGVPAGAPTGPRGHQEVDQERGEYGDGIADAGHGNGEGREPLPEGF